MSYGHGPAKGSRRSVRRTNIDFRSVPTGTVYFDECSEVPFRRDHEAVNQTSHVREVSSGWLGRSAEVEPAEPYARPLWRAPSWPESPVARAATPGRPRTAGQTATTSTTTDAGRGRAPASTSGAPTTASGATSALPAAASAPTPRPAATRTSVPATPSRAGGAACRASPSGPCPSSEVRPWTPWSGPASSKTSLSRAHSSADPRRGAARDFRDQSQWPLPEPLTGQEADARARTLRGAAVV